MILRWMTAAAVLALGACSAQMTTSSAGPAQAEPPKDEKIAMTPDVDDPRIWLEEVEGEEALDWVRAQNARSLAVLESDPRYEPFFQAALEVVNSKDKIPYGSMRRDGDGQVWIYNFWQDEDHVRGLWRRATLASYETETPEWETLLDIDALAASEGANWVYKGVDCLPPANDRCLVSLSDGGKDAVVRREFLVSTKSFVEGGFELPEAKQGSAWIDENTLLVATDWGEDEGGATVTASGYPFVLKTLQRGQALSEAKEVLRGDADDVGVWPMRMDYLDREGVERTVFGAVQADTFFTSTYWVWGGSAAGEAMQAPLPPKSSIRGVYRGQLIASLEQDWTFRPPWEEHMAQPWEEITFPIGSLVSFDLDAFLASGRLPPVSVLRAPKERTSVSSVAVSRDAVVVAISENVQGKLEIYRWGDGGWMVDRADLGENVAVNLISSNDRDSRVLVQTESFLQPDTLMVMAVEDGAAEPSAYPIKSMPAWFDASTMKVEQFEAVSKDGAKIPYFVVSSKELDGPSPTLLYGYGGFEVSLDPSYSGTTGRLWLENGGVYVLANIRGGGEFGPAWHQAGLKTKRQVIYDDFIAVGEDLQARGVTSPEKLGIMGGSNGGLLMGVMLTQRPDLWNAVVCQVPLLDMLRYHLLLAGASWVDEYGSPDVAEERAWLEAMSPYHNVDPAADYPEVFFVTSTKDDRVHPAHARKMAKLFEDLDKPFLYYENIDGGHSAAANLRERARRSALEYVYLSQKLMD